MAGDMPREDDVQLSTFTFGPATEDSKNLAITLIGAMLPYLGENDQIQAKATLLAAGKLPEPEDPEERDFLKVVSRLLLIGASAEEAGAGKTRSGLMLGGMLIGLRMAALDPRLARLTERAALVVMNNSPESGLDAATDRLVSRFLVDDSDAEAPLP